MPPNDYDSEQADDFGGGERFFGLSVIRLAVAIATMATTKLAGVG
jgi:hypothetical protein